MLHRTVLTPKRSHSWANKRRLSYRTRLRDIRLDMYVNPIRKIKCHKRKTCFHVSVGGLQPDLFGNWRIVKVTVVTDSASFDAYWLESLCFKKHHSSPFSTASCWGP